MSLDYIDYYAFMSMADFLEFEAKCKAGEADPARYQISAEPRR